jgi:hypothetical protein
MTLVTLRKNSAIAKWRVVVREGVRGPEHPVLVVWQRGREMNFHPSKVVGTPRLLHSSHFIFDCARVPETILAVEEAGG